MENIYALQPSEQKVSTLNSTQSKMSPLYTFWPPWLFDGLVQEASPFLLSSSLAYLNCKRGLLMRNLARLLLFPNIPSRMLLQVSRKVELPKMNVCKSIRVRFRFDTFFTILFSKATPISRNYLMPQKRLSYHKLCQ